MAVVTDIKTAAVAAVTALAMSPTPTVKARKRPILPASATLPAVVIAVTEGREVEDLYAGKVLVRYPMTVAIYTASTDTQDGSTVETWRQSIARKLNDESVYTGVGINRVDREDKTPFDAEGLDGQYNVSFLQFTVETIESRN